jgi:hypothetical protein
VVEFSTIINNGKDGVHYEVSDVGATIRNNIIQGNNFINNNYDGGVDILRSRNAVVENNIFGDNDGGADPAGVRARWYSGDYTLQNIVIRNNTMNGDRLVGCGGQVTCTNNN